MTLNLAYKQQIYKELIKKVEEKISSAQQAIDAAIESRDNETKSSVGDKYETGRAMMQLEQQRNEVQLAKAMKLKADLNQISLKHLKTKVEAGALVKSDNGIYFISIGLGKLSLENDTVYAISLQSPLGKLLLNKKEGEKISFNDKSILILQII